MMDRHLFALLALVMTSTAAVADLRPPQRVIEPITDPSMVVIDRGSKLEVLPTKRATPSLDSSSLRVVHHVTTAAAATPIDAQHLGVVFNHAMQAQGYISGEIAFKVRGGGPFSGSIRLFPGLKRITKPGVYVTNARTPAEFIEVLKRLQARTDLEWVEPTIIYGPTVSPSPARPATQ